jgi:hypothetical protein
VEYRLAIDSEVLHFILLLEEEEQAQVLRWFGKLKALPFTRGQFVVSDSEGRDVDASIVSNYLIYHWTDHAVKSVQVVKIELNI